MKDVMPLDSRNVEYIETGDQVVPLLIDSAKLRLDGGYVMNAKPLSKIGYRANYAGPTRLTYEAGTQVVDCFVSTYVASLADMHVSIDDEHICIMLARRFNNQWHGMKILAAGNF